MPGTPDEEAASTLGSALAHDETCWTLIHRASGGERQARSTFARHYLPLVRRHLESGWRDRLSPEEIEDATQAVFVECLKEGGLLAHAPEPRIRSFRAYLYGAIRNVVRRAEERRARRIDAPGSRSFHPEELARDEDGASRAFDRAWARHLMCQAVDYHHETARREGPDAEKRARLLELRFQHGRPIREIAALWGEDPAVLHRAYALARKEFRAALRRVVSFHHPGAPGSVDRECKELITLLE